MATERHIDPALAAGPRHVRLFVLELGMARPLDYALSQGSHDLKECGVAIQLDGTRVKVSWLGHGPRAFLLPGARQLQSGAWVDAEDRARIGWAGREWLFLAHGLDGETPVPPRGICLNGGAPGFPSGAVLLVEAGADRGNFFRFRTEPFELGPGVRFVAVRGKDGVDSIRLRVAAGGLASVDGVEVAPGAEVALASEQMIAVGPTDAPTLAARVIVA